MSAAQRLFGAVLLGAAVFVVASSMQLPPWVASHFDASGTANGFMPRAAYVGLMLVLVVVVPGASIALARRSLGRPGARINLPRREFWLAPARRERTVADLGDRLTGFGTLLVLFLCAAHWLVVQAQQGRPPVLDSTRFALALGLFLLALLVWILRLLRRYGARPPRP